METMEKTKEKTERKQLCTLKIERDEDGLSVFVKSPMFEGFFLKASKGKTEPSGVNWGMGKISYDAKDVTTPRGDYNFGVTASGYASYPIMDVPNGRIDVSFIKTVGLKDGASFHCDGLFMQKDIDAFVKDFTMFVKGFFTTYIKKVKIEVTVVSIL